jgi:hypothetical protein
MVDNFSRGLNILENYRVTDQYTGAILEVKEIAVHVSADAVVWVCLCNWTLVLACSSHECDREQSTTLPPPHSFDAQPLNYRPSISADHSRTL